MPVLFEGSIDDFETAIRTSEVISSNGKSYPLKEFITSTYQRSYKNITADGSGLFQALVTDSVAMKATLRSHWISVAGRNSLTADFKGKWFANKEDMRQLGFILLVSFRLMYLIITAELNPIEEMSYSTVTDLARFRG